MIASPLHVNNAPVMITLKKEEERIDRMTMDFNLLMNETVTRARLKWMQSDMNN